MTTVNVKNKEIDVSKLASLIVEDSHDVDEFLFVVDDDLSELNVFVLYTNPSEKGYIDLLEQVEGGYVWKPSHRATVEEGNLKIQLVGLSFDNGVVTNRWSSLYADINIQKNIEAEELVDEPGQSLIEDEICGELE